MITVFCKTTDGNSETVVKDYEHIPDPGRPAGTIRYTPLSGSATFVQISVFDSEGRFALETSERIPLTGAGTVSAVVRGIRYKLDSTAKTAEVTGTGKKDAGTITIPATVKAGGETYKVTAIADKAFKSMEKLTEVTIGKHIARIGKKKHSAAAPG